MAIRMKPYVRQVVTAEVEIHGITVLRTRDLMDVSDEPVASDGTGLVTEWIVKWPGER